MFSNSLDNLLHADINNSYDKGWELLEYAMIVGELESVYSLSTGAVYELKTTDRVMLLINDLDESM